MDHQYTPDAVGRCQFWVVLPAVGKMPAAEMRCGFPKWMHDKEEKVSEPDEPQLNILVVECAVCHEELLNRLTRWTHRPESTQTDHLPEPQTRMAEEDPDRTPDPRESMSPGTYSSQN
jgi:hypothetical protein